MPNPLLLDVATFLIAQNVCSIVYRDNVPETPDTIISLVEYTGQPLTDGIVNRSVQLISRHKDADVARQNALKAFKALQGALTEDNKVAFTADRWGQVYLRQAPFKLYEDGSSRTCYAFNMGITTTIE
jgi:hypothetical protein